jgi:hypothetical protein
MLPDHSARSDYRRLVLRGDALHPPTYRFTDSIDMPPKGCATRPEIEDALSMVPKQEAGRGSVFRFIGKAAEVRVNTVTGTIVTVIRFTGPGAASPLP